MKPSTRDRRPIHHSPVFWIGIVLCLAAIAIYLWSDDLSWRPGTVGGRQIAKSLEPDDQWGITWDFRFGLELKILFIYQSGRCLECRKAQA